MLKAIDFRQHEALKIMEGNPEACPTMTDLFHSSFTFFATKISVNKMEAHLSDYMVWCNVMLHCDSHET